MRILRCRKVWQAEGEVARYDAALAGVFGATRRATPTATIGVEIDVSARWAAAEGLDVGWSRIFA